MRDASSELRGSVTGFVLMIALAFHVGLPAQAAELPGLGGPALVVYDSNAIPHICTGSDRDTYFMQGYIHAQDRFFQMDMLRRQFSGTLAELVGPAALGSDVQLRTLGLRRAAEETLAAAAAGGLADFLEALEAYTRGVNAYLSGNPLPPEYGALELSQAAPWTAVDSLVIGKGLAFGLSFDLVELDLTIQAAAYSEVGASLGFDGLALLFEDVSRTAPFDPTVSIPPFGSGAKAEGDPAVELTPPNRRTAELARRYREKALQVPVLAKTLDRRERAEGSNWWIVAGENSLSGHAMLANDPHLGLDTPSIFYEAHLISSAEPGCGLAADGDAAVFLPADPAAKRISVPGLNVNGVTFAGAPGVVLGCNQDICWGATTNPMDVTDVYQEVLEMDPGSGLPSATIFDGQPEPLVLIPQTYGVNQIGDQVADNIVDAGIGPLDGGLTMVVPRRNNGPIVMTDASQQPVTALSVQYTGWRATFELEAFRLFQRASNLDEFTNGLQYFDVGSQNFAYADVNGNIAYFTSAEMPIREDLQTLNAPDGGVPPFLIRDGTHTLRHEWLPVQNPQPQQALAFEILPFGEMPQVVNPEAGYVINANNDPVGTSLDNDPLDQVRPGGGLFYMSPGYADGLRAGRIGRLIGEALAGGQQLTTEDMERFQANNQLLDAELVVPFVTAALANAADPGAPAELQALATDPGVAEAVTRLSAWNFSTPTGIPQGYDPGDDPDNLPAPSAAEIANSVAGTIWSVYRGQLTRDVVDQTLTGLGLGSFLPGSSLAYKTVKHLLENWYSSQGFGASGVDFFSGPEGLTREQARDWILLQNMRKALDLLASDEFGPAFSNSTDQDDYRWGSLHRIVFDHALGGPFNIPPAGGFENLAPELPGIARSGGYGAVDASSHSARADGVNEFMFGSGPARRFVGVLDPAGIDAEQIIPGGESGVLGSPHYASQLGRWLTNGYHPLLLTEEAVRGDAVFREEFLGGCEPGPATLCLQNGRFKVQGVWEAPWVGLGMGPAGVAQGSSNVSGNLFFFNPHNWELLVKVLDGCSINGHYWVFAGAATDLGWNLMVEDTATGQVKSYISPVGWPAPAITDTSAFATCP